MLLIIAHHYVINSGLERPILEHPLLLKSIFLTLFGAWGKTGINCFVLITGYYMCMSNISLKKFVKLLFTVEFYNILFYTVFLITGYQEFSFISLFKAIFPMNGVSTGGDFVSCYLLFYLSIPFLNVLLKNINERQHLKLILLLGFIYIILGTIPKVHVSMNYFSWFITVYFIAAFVRMHPKKIFNNLKLWKRMALVSFLVSIISVIGCVWLGTILGKNISHYFVSDSNKLLAVVTAFCAFMFFKNLKIKYSRLINILASSTFGVLLIHNNSDVMRNWLWRNMLNNVKMYNSPFLIPHAFGSVLGIYIACTIIDQIRIKFIETPFLEKWSTYSGKFISYIKSKVYSKIKV